MKKYIIHILVIVAFIATLLSIDAFRKAFLFDTKIAYAANEPWFAWMKVGDEEIQILFETTLTSRTLTIKEFCQIYGLSLDSGTGVVEQWCKQHDNSQCQMRFVGSFLMDNNSPTTLLPVVPEYMYY